MKKAKEFIEGINPAFKNMDTSNLNTISYEFLVYCVDKALKKDKTIEYDVCKVAIDELREAAIKTIEVEECGDCPFYGTSETDGSSFCVMNNDIDYFEDVELPVNCPLKDNNYRIKLN
jgi:hypothetical protein